MYSDIGGTRPGKYGSRCLRKAVPPAPVGSFYYPFPICPSSDENPQSFSYSPYLGVCVCVSICVHSLDTRGTLPPSVKNGKQILGFKVFQFLMD